MEMLLYIMERYVVMDISGDVGLKVFASSLEELFINASEGLYSLITDISRIELFTTLRLKVEEENVEKLLVAWLNELIYYFDISGFVGRTMTVRELDGKCLVAEVTGEEFDEKRHEQGTLIKAATYHKLNVHHREGLWSAEVVFDI